MINKFKSWRKQRRLNRIAKLMRLVIDHKVGYTGVNKKTGTVLYCKDIYFDMRQNRVQYKYTKVFRGQNKNRK